MSRSARRLGDRPGLQAERTVLAWDRTALGFLANGALLLVRNIHTAQYQRWLPAVAAFGLGVACFTLARLRQRRLTRTPPERIGPARGPLTTITVFICLLAVLVIVFLIGTR
ncbi:DUF202 domain-containing protein [Pseudonocardia acidicola]|uniref:DUF202 domain-containing protein n=1 Tax=Pseudonocardia acidicola TaxID=2724939 RepID=A0ABX1S7Q9_9PSEU|nr:DUF202 domain-containing protein [Pseudonocardia acidicola]NMH97600.1 DUF202 domain-containing protein [Pseudonocardia acidicola]